MLSSRCLIAAPRDGRLYHPVPRVPQSSANARANRLSRHLLRHQRRHDRRRAARPRSAARARCATRSSTLGLDGVEVWRGAGAALGDRGDEVSRACARPASRRSPRAASRTTTTVIGPIATIRDLIAASALEPVPCASARSPIFARLAEAEGAVHGVATDDVDVPRGRRARRDRRRGRRRARLHAPRHRRDPRTRRCRSVGASSTSAHGPLAGARTGGDRAPARPAACDRATATASW